MVAAYPIHKNCGGALVPRVVFGEKRIRKARPVRCTRCRMCPLLSEEQLAQATAAGKAELEARAAAEKEEVARAG